MATAYILQRNRITPKLLFTARASHYEHYPLVKGNVAPSFSLNSNDDLILNNRNIQHTKDHSILLDDFLADQKPLVLIFYNPGKQKAANLLFFQSLNRAVTARGAKLLIITSLKYLAVNEVTSALNIYKDSFNAIARAFGLYDPQNPLWNWIPGIEETDAFLPAFYVIAPGKQIIYHHIDYNFSLFNDPGLMQHLFVQRLLSSVDSNVIDTATYYPVSHKLVS